MNKKTKVTVITMTRTDFADGTFSVSMSTRHPKSKSPQLARINFLYSGDSTNNTRDDMIRAGHAEVNKLIGETFNAFTKENENPFARMPAIEVIQEFQATADGDNPGSRLLGTIAIGGVLHHVEGIEVKYADDTGEQSSVADVNDVNYDELWMITQTTPKPITLKDRQYVLLITPHSE